MYDFGTVGITMPAVVGAPAEMVFVVCNLVEQKV
jgi:hypothetical protein